MGDVRGTTIIIKLKMIALKLMFTKVIYIWIRHTTPSYAKFSFQSHTDFTVFYRLYSWGPVDRSIVNVPLCNKCVQICSHTQN